MKSKLYLSMLWVLLGLLVLMGLKGLFAKRMDLAGSNVILITADSLRPDHLAPYGYKENTTPNLDKLAGDSTMFYYCFAQSSHPDAALAGIFTASVPSMHGVLGGKRVFKDGGENSAAGNSFQLLDLKPLGPGKKTLAEGLSEIGYTTAGFTSSGFSTKENGFSRGFNVFEDAACLWDSAKCVVGKADQWLSGSPKPPFFLWAQFTDLMDDFPAAKARHGLRPHIKQAFSSGDGADERAAVAARYDSKLAYLDGEIGRLLDRLKALGLYEGSLIVLAGVNGEELGEHGNYGNGTTVYNEQIHVPLIIKLPGNQYKKNIVETMVRQADVAPTILEVAGGAAMSGVFGVSLVADIQGIGADPMEVYSECRADGLDQAVLERKYKLIFHAKTGEKEFFNIEKDFREKKNTLKEKEMDADRLYKRIVERFH
ncbi:MAG: sulfatase [Nitrospinae bacterium]|nr:sulfatase [Nitrospinota bacterium]